MRSDYQSEKGIASWWEKDGAWHIAFPGVDCLGNKTFLWTADMFDDRESAIKAIENRVHEVEVFFIGMVAVETRSIRVAASVAARASKSASKMAT